MRLKGRLHLQNDSLCISNHMCWSQCSDLLRESSCSPVHAGKVFKPSVYHEDEIMDHTSVILAPNQQVSTSTKNEIVSVVSVCKGEMDSLTLTINVSPSMETWTLLLISSRIVIINDGERNIKWQQICPWHEKAFYWEFKQVSYWFLRGETNDGLLSRK